MVIILHYRLYSSFVMWPSDTCATWRDSFVIISYIIHSSEDTLIHIITSHIHTHSHIPRVGARARARARTHTHTHARARARANTHHYLYIINSSI